jgi:hypothetical protein
MKNETSDRIFFANNDMIAAKAIYDLLKVSESTIDFWDNKDDEVWDNV